MNAPSRRPDPTVGVNASIVGESPTGLGLYSTHLVRGLDQIRDDLVVYSSCPQALGELRAPARRVVGLVRPELGLRGHLVRFMWLQSVFRVKSRASRLGAVLNTLPEGVLGSPIPQVTVVHDLVPMRLAQHYPRQQLYFRVLVPRVLRASRLIVAVSENTRRDIIATYGVSPDSIRVIHPGYDATVYNSNGTASAGAPDDPYFLYIGNLLPHKNLLRLLDAFAILRRRQACRLIIRGESRRAYGRVVHERIETLGLSDSVSLRGYASERDLRSLYIRAVCCVIPSLYEGFGLPVLEAMACGTPVIVSRTSSLPEVAGDAAVTTDPYDAISLADAMYRVLTDADLRQELRQRGLRRARLFSWARTAEQVSSLLDEVRAGRGRRCS